MVSNNKRPSKEANMQTVKFEGDIAPVLEEFDAIQWNGNAAGEYFIFDSKAREWVKLENGDTIVNSEEGYYIGDKKGNPEKVAEGADATRSAADTQPVSEETQGDDVITSDDVDSDTEKK